jgi:predicted amidohydrolase
MRIALATLPFEGSIAGAVARVRDALREAADRGARVVCTPENYLPGYRGAGPSVEPPDADALGEALERVGEHARAAGVALVLGAELPTERGLLMSAVVYDAAGRRVGRQDKVQLDPSEDAGFVAGVGRSVFDVEGLRFGIAICHEGWRYPETVRWAACRGAQLVFHPHLSPATAWGAAPDGWADPRNSFHEKAAMCRAAENGIYFATVNYAVPASETASAVINPDGSLLAYQPHGTAGLLVADLDLTAAGGVLARRYRPADHDAPPH